MTKRVEILPDSRANIAHGVIRGPHGNWLPIFCANCGTKGGLVPEENMTFAFWLCDPCWEKHGAIAATYVLPDEVFWAEVAAEQQGQAIESLKRG
jgi:hypothetical protein